MNMKVLTPAEAEARREELLAQAKVGAEMLLEHQHKAWLSSLEQGQILSDLYDSSGWRNDPRLAEYFSQKKRVRTGWPALVYWLGLEGVSISRQRAEELRAAYLFSQALKAANAAVTPTSEWQIRPLVRLRASVPVHVELWHVAVAGAGGKAPTAKAVAAVVAYHRQGLAETIVPIDEQRRTKKLYTRIRRMLREHSEFDIRAALQAVRREEEATA